MILQTAGACGVVLLMGAACGRDDAGPEVQTSSGVQPRMESVSVRGCLKTGLAESTFVLTTTESGPQGETATYQLNGAGVNFANYVGQQVDVAGTLRAEQATSSSGVDVVEKSKGTSGQPVIETTSELNLKHMTVKSIKPSGQRCIA
ncbi:MAG TPA: hypothetical protein VM818_10445 [Vicinamibacterales bacterium]|nr:hypothetical protein [Vicinamibacterales bacterium]